MHISELMTKTRDHAIHMSTHALGIGHVVAAHQQALY